jgi:hypothetical protein
MILRCCVVASLSLLLTEIEASRCARSFLGVGLMCYRGCAGSLKQHPFQIRYPSPAMVYSTVVLAVSHLGST